MKNYVAPGAALVVTAPDGTEDVDVSSGDIVKVGAIVGVAVNDAAMGEEVVINTTGIYSVAKVSAQAWGVGDAIYFDAATKLATTTSGGNTLIGVATAIAANPSATGEVRLDGAFGR